MRLLTLAVVVLVVAIPVALGSPLAYSTGRLPNGSSIAGVNVSLMLPEDAMTVLDSEITRASSRQFTIVFLGKDYVYTPADIGIIYSADTSVRQIMRSGEGGKYELAVELNPAQFQAHIDQLFAKMPEPAKSAQVDISGTQARVTDAVDGKAFNIGSYKSEVVAEAQKSNPQVDISLQMSEADISTAEAQETADQVNAMLQKPIVFEAADGTWEITPEEYAAALVVLPDGNGGLAITWDLDVLQPMIGGFIAEIENTDRADAWIQDLGTHKWLVPERGSSTVDRKKLIEEINDTLLLGEHNIRVPVTNSVASKTTEDVMSELGITGIIASGDSIYSGSGFGRNHNVETAAFYIDRTLVAPGGTYSFNDSVGNLFNGEYLSAGSYIDGPAGESIAGGVCQVSTTVFRAALNAGFPIEERWPHSYRSTFYELGGWSPGYDAAIVQDSGAPEETTDMRFTNPTDSWLMITAKADGDRLIVEIWGADTGYSVTYSEPDVWVAHSAPSSITVMVDDQLPRGTMERQEPLDGLGVSLTRYVYDRNGELVLTDVWQTTYYATGPILRVSPDMEDEAYAKSGR